MVNFGHDRLGALIGMANDDTIGTLEVVDCGTFAKEFRIGHHSEICTWVCLANDASSPSPVPTGTVDFVTITVKPLIDRAISRAAA